MDTDTVLQRIVTFADTAHDKQMRRYTPDRYIVHPIRVMETCKNYTNNITVLAAALMHDVLEDTPVAKEEIKAFLVTLMSEAEATKTVQLVEELTDVYTKERYPEWNRKKRKRKEAVRLEKASAEAQTIEYADIIDNAAEITKKDPGFAKTFLPEYRALLKRMDKGNPVLYNKAELLVNDCIAQLP